jgi:hypothetical protein
VSIIQVHCRLLTIYTNLYLANIHGCKLNGIPWRTRSFHVLIRKVHLAWWWPCNGSKHVAYYTSVNIHISMTTSIKVRQTQLQYYILWGWPIPLCYFNNDNMDHIKNIHIFQVLCLTEYCLLVRIYEGVSKIFRTDAVKIINLTTKRVWKLPTFTHLRATWHTDSIDMVVLPSTGSSRYHNCCVDDGTSSEYFGYTIVHNGMAPLIIFHTCSKVLRTYTWSQFSARRVLFPLSGDSMLPKTPERIFCRGK